MPITKYYCYSCTRLCKNYILKPESSSDPLLFNSYCILWYVGCTYKYVLNKWRDSYYGSCSNIFSDRNQEQSTWKPPLWRASQGLEIVMNLKSKVNKNEGKRCVCETRENSRKRRAIQLLDLGSTMTCKVTSVITTLWQMSVY